MDFKGLIYLSMALCTGALGKDLRIVGGENTHPAEFPYQASLRLLGQLANWCGGVIITEKHILSVAHCIYGWEHMYPFIRVFTGIENIIDYNKKTHIVTWVRVHEGYTGEKSGLDGYLNDIAIYTLLEPIEFNAFQNKIDLPTEDAPRGIKVMMSGWGIITYPEADDPYYLQKAEVTLLTTEDCQSRFAFPILEDQICTLEEGKGACTGDSGGPLVKDGKLYGLVSITKPCARGIPDIHTNVFTHLSFINSVIAP